MLELLLCSMLTILPTTSTGAMRRASGSGGRSTSSPSGSSCAGASSPASCSPSRSSPSSSTTIPRRRTSPPSTEPCPSCRRATAASPSCSSAARRGWSAASRSSASTAPSRRPRSRRRADRSRRSTPPSSSRAPTSPPPTRRSSRPRPPCSRPSTNSKPSRSSNRRNADIVARREIERLENVVAGRRGAVEAANAARQAVQTKLTSLLPAQKASAEAALAQAQVELDKTVIRAGVTGRVEQFALQVGDIVNPFARPAGVPHPRIVAALALRRLRPDRGAGAEARDGGRGKLRLQAVDRHPDGRHRGAGLHRQRPVPRRRAAHRRAERAAPRHRPRAPRAALRGGPRRRGARLELRGQRLFEQPRGDRIGQALHRQGHRAAVVDAVGLVHAMLLRIQVLLLPIQTLVFAGH